MDPADAHSNEIFEAIIDAGMRGDQEAFEQFCLEWERLGITDDEGRQVSFAGSPVHYEYQSYCGHCEGVWAVWGIHFGKMVPGVPVMIHMDLQCPAAHLCHCFDHNEHEDFPFGYPVCQRCERVVPICECDNGPILGSCAMIELYDRLQAADEAE